MRPSWIWWLLAGSALAPQAVAQSDLVARRPTAELLQACEAVVAGLPDTLPGTRCIAFVEGFVWGHGWAAWREVRDPFFCPPGEGPLSARSFLPAIVAYWRAHPERLDQPAHLMLFAALSSAYPCPAVDTAPATPP